MPLKALDTPAEWAEDALTRVGYDLTKVERVFMPDDVFDLDYAEVLYLDGHGKPRTAYIEPPRKVIWTRPGW